jgi:hypothetical protein
MERTGTTRLLVSWDTNHWPTPLKPFDVAAWLLSEISARQAHIDAGIPLHPILRDFLVPNGFLYVHRAVRSDEENSQIQLFTNRMGASLACGSNSVSRDPKSGTVGCTAGVE